MRFDILFHLVLTLGGCLHDATWPSLWEWLRSNVALWGQRALAEGLTISLGVVSCPLGATGAMGEGPMGA